MAAAGVGGYIAVRTGSMTQPAVSAAAQPAQDIAGPPTVVAEEPASEARPALPAERSPESTSRTSRPQQVASPSAPERSGRVAQVARPEASSSGSARAEAPAPAPVATPNPPSPVPPIAAATPPVPEMVEAPAAATEPPARRAVREDLTVPRAEVINIRLETPVSSETAKVEDRVTARVTRDVTVDRVSVIPAGTKLEGVVTTVERGGRVRNQARVGIRFTTVVLSPEVKLPIQTEAILREGEGPGNEAASKIGGAAVVGTILGTIFGGGKGAAIGGAVGAAGGTAAVMSGDRNHAVIAAGTYSVHLTAPLTISIERE